jgi:hypothetical protein
MDVKQPVRRIGSWTLGISLIVCGVCFLLYYFVPGFDFLLAAKLSPLLLIALGGEVLYYAVHPGAGRYDFLSAIAVLGIMVCCYFVSLLPAVWQQLYL